MAHLTRYQVLLDRTGQPIGINGVDVMGPLAPGGAPAHLAPAPPPPPAVVPQVTPALPKLNLAIHHLASTLNSLPSCQYGIHGSCAAMIRGALLPSPPSDIDVLASPYYPAVQALLATGHFQHRSGGSQLVAKLRHVNGTELDVADPSDFLPVYATSPVGGARVFILLDVLLSLILRPERREKEVIAFASLVLTRGNELSTVEQTKVAHIARLPNWSAVVDNAKAAAADFKLQLR